VQDLWGDADNRARVPDRHDDVHHEALRVQASESGEALVMKVVMSRLAQLFLQPVFIFGLLALVLTCLVLAGPTPR
jgi:hypothetical protein